MVEMHRFRLTTEDIEFEENEWYLEGFDAFHAGKPFAILTTNSNWRAGWFAAETGNVVKVE